MTRTQSDPVRTGRQRREAPPRSAAGRLARLGAGLLGIAIGVAVWAFVTSGVVTDDPVISGMSPAQTWSGFTDLVDRGVLLEDAGVSLYRLVAGLLVAALLGVPVGLWLGLRRRAEAVAGPLVQFLRMISPLSWAPVAVRCSGSAANP